MSNIDDVKTWLQNLQNRICAELETVDGKAVFAKDAWERPAGGGGISRVLSEGAVFELHLPRLPEATPMGPIVAEWHQAPSEKAV